MNKPTDISNRRITNKGVAADVSGAHDTAPQQNGALSQDLTPVITDLGENEQEQRRSALRSMLAASEARQHHMKRARNQTLAAGLTVSIKSGLHAGARGVILDADYIHNRVLVDLSDGSEGIWVSFNVVSSVAQDSNEDDNHLTTPR